MTDPWRCPECKTWIRADVSEHRCGPDGGVLAAVGSPPSVPPPASMAMTAPPHALWGTATTATAGSGVTFTVTADGQELAGAVRREMHRWNLRQGGRGLRAV